MMSSPRYSKNVVDPDLRLYILAMTFNGHAQAGGHTHILGDHDDDERGSSIPTPLDEAGTGMPDHIAANYRFGKVQQPGEYASVPSERN